MENQINKPLRPSEWRLSEAHGFSLLPIEDRPNLQKWRDAVENQGCKFILATMVRDPLRHTISQLKVRQNIKLLNNDTQEMRMVEWLGHLGSNNPRAISHWPTQLDYFLFNLWDKNLELNNTMTKEEKVGIALEMLREHFDLVMYQNHELFVEIITKMIGVSPMPLLSTNEHELEINFTSEELNLMKKKILKNGDVDWINAIRYVFERHLQYVILK